MTLLAPDGRASGRMHAWLARSILLVAILARTSDAQEHGGDTLATKIKLAEGAAARWLALVDSGRYAASWDSAATSFRTAISRTDWNTAVTAARSQVDPLGRRRLSNAQYARELHDAPPGEYVVLQFSTTTRNDTSVLETITLAREGQRTWRVIGYFIKPE